MDKETLSHYGWIVVLILILSVMMALATPLGQFIAEGFKATYVGFGYVNDNALGIFGQSISGPPEVKYYQPYRADFPWGSMEFVFHKDGAVDIYYYEEDYKSGDIYYPGEAIYKDGTIEFDGMVFTVSEDSTTITVDDIEFTLIPTPIKPLSFNTEYICPHEEWESSMSFFENGSADYREYEQEKEVYYWHIDEGTMRYYSEYFEEYYSDDEIYRYAVYPNGTKIIMGGDVYEVSCTHENTEIRNQTDDYSGDKYCTNCGALVQKGYEIADKYAIILKNPSNPNDNMPLVFINGGMAIGTTYNSTKYGECDVVAVYSGFETDIYEILAPEENSLRPYDAEMTIDEIIERSKSDFRGSTVPWYEYKNGITSVSMECDVKPASTYGWFFELQNCKTIDLSRMDMSLVEDVTMMFYDCGITQIPKMNNTQNIKYAEEMFAYCYNLVDTNGFNVPERVEDMRCMFRGCKNLADFSSIVVGENITNMGYAFQYCLSMTTAPVISGAINLDELENTFDYCTSLEATPVFPNNLKYMHEAFANCTSLKTISELPQLIGVNAAFTGCTTLTTAPILPETLEYCYTIFSGCESLNTYVGSTEGVGNFKNYKIPSALTGLDSAFEWCSSIVTPPDLDYTKITSLSSTFRGCASLKYAPKLPSTVTNLSNTFAYCQNLIEAPQISHCTGLTHLVATFQNCKSLTVAPLLPNTITTMWSAFENAGINTYEGSTQAIGDFTGYIIPQTTINMSETFRGCEGLVHAPTIPSSVIIIEYVYYDCINLETVVFNTNRLSGRYNYCLGVSSYETGAKNITISGTSSQLTTFAKTSTAGKRIVYDVNGNILAQ